MAKHNAHSPEVRAAVLAALMAGQSVSEVAKEHGISEGTIWSWKQRSKPVMQTAQDEKRAADLGELIGDYLQEVLTTLAVQARHFRDVAWLKTQPAADLAVLHGVLNDKAIRLLASLQPANDPTDRNGDGQ